MEKNRVGRHFSPLILGEEAEVKPNPSISATKTSFPRKQSWISKGDIDYVEWSEFKPLQEPGPHLPDNQTVTVVDLLHLCISDDMLEQFIIATNAYAEAKRSQTGNVHTL